MAGAESERGTSQMNRNGMRGVATPTGELPVEVAQDHVGFLKPDTRMVHPVPKLGQPLTRGGALRREIAQVSEQNGRHPVCRLYRRDGGDTGNGALGAIDGGVHLLERLPQEVAVDGRHGRSPAQEKLDAGAAA